MHLEKPYYSGTSKDFGDTLKYSALTGSRPHIETFSLDQVNEAYKHMIKGQASRAALKID